MGFIKYIFCVMYEYQMKVSKSVSSAVGFSAGALAVINTFYLGSLLLIVEKVSSNQLVVTINNFIFDNGVLVITTVLMVIYFSIGFTLNGRLEILLQLYNEESKRNLLFKKLTPFFFLGCMILFFVSISLFTLS